MNTRRTTLYHALLDGKIVLVSLFELNLHQLSQFYWFEPTADYSFEEVTLDVPYEIGRTELWESNLPHVHWSCRYCESEHNFDLDTNDENPRLAGCDRHGDMGMYTLVAWSHLSAG